MNTHGRFNLYFIKAIKTNPVCYYVSNTTTSYIYYLKIFIMKLERKHAPHPLKLPLLDHVIHFASENRDLGIVQ